MKSSRTICLMTSILISSFSYAQKTVSEGTIAYTITIKDIDKNTEGKNDLTASSIIYLKGNLSRTDMISPLGSETTIHGFVNGNSVVLKQYSGQKLMITLSKENWQSKYKKYAGTTFQPTAETKVIATYNCKKAIAKLKDGSMFIVYYTADINTMDKNYDPIFEGLPGLPVQYEFTAGKHTFIYVLSKIDLDPVPASKFDIPKSGYRIMTYDEAREHSETN